MDFYKTTRCRNIGGFLDRVHDLTNKGWIFRGQQRSTWPLAHRLERACSRLGIEADTRQQVELNMMREFRRRLHHYAIPVPHKDACCESLALMQHYGAPTRLLDFTYSPYVAAYFAFEFAEANHRVAVWAIDFEWLSKHLEEVSADLYQKYRKYQLDREASEGLFREIFIDCREPSVVLATNPFRLNERLAYQRGVFLCPNDVSVPLMDNLSRFLPKSSKRVIKFTIPTGLHNENTIEALETLDSMNVSRITLFPGLDGFAQSLETRIKSLFERQLNQR